jgi:hypothetical protein
MCKVCCMKPVPVPSQLTYSSARCHCFRPDCSAPSPFHQYQAVPNQAPIEAAVSELIKRNQHLQNALTIKTDTKAQLEGQIRDLAITVALHAKANKELYRDLSRARDQIWRLRFQHEALDWISQDEPILSTSKTIIINGRFIATIHSRHGHSG